MKNKKPILLLEDDEIDQETIRRAFKELKVNNPLVVASNGEEGLAYLNNPQNDQPCLIILDLVMPKMNGFDFLKTIKAHDTFKIIPVVVLSTSEEDRSRVESFGLGVAGYMLKPTDHTKFFETIRIINLYWTLSELPPSLQ